MKYEEIEKIVEAIENYCDENGIPFCEGLELGEVNIGYYDFIINDNGDVYSISHRVEKTGGRTFTGDVFLDEYSREIIRKDKICNVKNGVEKSVLDIVNYINDL